MKPDYMIFCGGAIFAAYVVIGLFFWRFRKRTGDRFFGWFAAAFWILALERILLVPVDPEDNRFAPVHLARLLAFLLILAAIIDKNRSVKRR